jgi:heme exporter protein D
MADLGPHAAFIVGAYTVAVLIMAAMIAWVWIDHRRQAKLLAELESRGVTRRSTRKADDGQVASSASGQVQER